MATDTRYPALSGLHSPDFGRLVTTLFAGKAAAPPLIELGIHPLIKGAILGRPILSVQDDIEFMRSTGYDFIKIQPVIDFDLNLQVAKAKQAPGLFGEVADRAWASERKGVITSWKEFEQYSWPQTSDISFRYFEEARTLLPEGMGIIGQYGDIFTVVWEMMGFETFALSTFEHPDLVQALFDRVGGLIMSMFETMASMDFVGALWFSDDIAYTGGPMLSPNFFRQHFFPFVKRIGELARKRHIPFIYHSDGVLWSMMEDIIESGVTALHPIEPKSMDIRDVQKRYGDRLCLCGGVDVDLLARGTVDDVKMLVRRLLRDVAKSGGWCVGSSNSIPEYVPVANYLAMVETVLCEGTC